MKKVLQLFTLSFFFIACEKEETKISSREPNQKEEGLIEDTLKSFEKQTIEVNVTKDYIYQVFYDLEEQQEVKRVQKDTWDIAVDYSEGTWYVVLNSSKAMFAGKSEQNFENTTSKNGIDLKWDHPAGGLGQLAIGKELEGVYVIDRGIDVNLDALGYKKVAFEVSDEELIIKSADLDGSNVSEQRISPTNNTQTIELGSNHKTNVFPSNWDIVFTQYTHQFDANTPYLVTGILVNQNAVEVAQDSIHDFETMSFEDVSRLTFSSEKDIIGYDWKTYSREAGSYTVGNKKFYIVKTASNRYYKLRFIDFYDGKGEKGNFVFELQELG